MLHPSPYPEPAVPFICRSRALERVLADARRAARSDLTVLLTGETGSGKGRIAREIHDHSSRRKRPFVVWSVPEGSESLAAGALFGHVKGAFTGADRDAVGILESAHTGTLVIDDVDKMGFPLQSQLLRFLDQWTIRPVGSSVLRSLDLRLIVTANRPLPGQVGKGEFLPDLMWRLSGLQLRVPPLRERREDLAALIDHFAGHFARCLRRPAPRFSRGALQVLFDQPWPGNVRELAAAVENLVFQACDRSAIQAVDVRRALGVERSCENGNGRREGYGPRDARLTSESLARAMEMAQGNGAQAAALLGVPLRTARRWLARYRMNRPAAGGFNGNGATIHSGNGHSNGH